MLFLLFFCFFKENTFDSPIKLVNSNSSHHFTNEKSVKTKDEYNHNKTKKKLKDSTGKCGPSLKYTITSNTLSINGVGQMTNFQYLNDCQSSSPWNEERSNIKYITIENGATSIGNVAFISFTNLTTNDIPESVTYIGTKSFWFCTNLQSIKIPDKTTHIGTWAFS